MGRNLRVPLIDGVWSLIIAGLLVVSVSASVLGGGDGVKTVTAGYRHSCAQMTDRTVRCWGADGAGQLGDGTTGDPTTHLRLTSVKVRRQGGFLTGVTAVSAGQQHTCAVKGNGTVWCWGDDKFGQLGDGTTGDPTTHLRLKAVQVRRGSGFLTHITGVSAGASHTCARRSDGTAWCWGYDGTGQLGDGTTGDPTTHLRLKAVKVRRAGGAFTGIAGVAAGGDFSCARRSDGTAWCWGWDGKGQLGDGTTGDPTLHQRLTPVGVKRGGDRLTGVTRISAGGDHACARRSDGTAWCWGDDSVGQLGDGTTGDPTTHHRLTAVKVRTAGGVLTRVAGVSAGDDHSCARRANGTAWCWGNDSFGGLGDGTTGDPTTHLRLTAVRVVRQTGELSDVRSVDAGGSHSCAVRGNGTAWCWGWDHAGQLGVGDADDDPHAHPTRVAFP